MGWLVYDGPSALDPTIPILGIITTNTRNRKTGPMHQLWILVKWEHPVNAKRNGQDRAICGACPIHHKCYVVEVHGPRAVWEAYLRGRYGWSTPSGETLRLGAYGDPAALPIQVIHRVLGGYRWWTGYTHQWRSAPQLRPYCMASVESVADQQAAEAAGWRTFRIGQDPHHGEIWCPVPRTTCHRCHLCDGKVGPSDRRKSIVIAPHGSRWSGG